MGSRRKGREYALQALYLVDVSELSPEKALNGILNEPHIDKDVNKFARHLTLGTLAHKTEIDQLISTAAQNWEINRMAALDRNILRLGAYELFYEGDTPTSVVIDEAVEIAKIYSTVDSGKFVNGILDRIKLERNAARETKS